MGGRPKVCKNVHFLLFGQQNHLEVCCKRMKWCVIWGWSRTCAQVASEEWIADLKLRRKMQWIGAKWPKIDRTRAQKITHNEIWLVRSNLIYPKPGTRFNSAWKKNTWPRFPRFLHPHRLSTWGSQPKDASPSLPLVWMLQSMEQPGCADSPIAPHLCPGPALRKSLTTRHVK